MKALTNFIRRFYKAKEVKKGVMSLQLTPRLNPDAPVFCPGEAYSNSVSSNSMKEPNANAFATLREIRVKT